MREPDRQPRCSDCGVDPDGPSAPAPPDGVSFRPPFREVVSAWTFEIVASMRMYSKSGSSFKALKRLSQTPARNQRRNRVQTLFHCPGADGGSRQGVAHRLMSIPGAVVALTCRSAVDNPSRFMLSKTVGPWVGLTPSRNQSGERDISGGITKAGDVNLRRALCQAAVMMHRDRPTWLRTGAVQAARRRGAKPAMIALPGASA